MDRAPSSRNAEATANADPLRARSRLAVRLFAPYVRRYVRRNFHGVRLSRAGLPRVPADRPAIVYLNHPSWWDPLIVMVLATTRFPGRRGFGPIDADALARYRFMRRLGLFGIEPDTPRGAATFLRASLRILAERDAMLWVTAEGAFTDVRARPIRLRPGLAHLVRRATEATIVPLAVEYPFWDERYPEALCRFGGPVAVADRTALGVEDWTRLLEDRLTATMDALAEEAMTRDPSLFVPVIRGVAGIGGVYDQWRRLAAFARGRRFSPEHGRPEA